MPSNPDARRIRVLETRRDRAGADVAFLGDLFQSGPIPTLEMGLGFASARHRLIVDNLANADTPGYRRKDLDAAAFREALRGALRGPGSGARSAEAAFLRHDGNDVDLEKELALLSANGSFHNRMAALLRKAFEQIRIAAAERPPAA